MPEIITQKIHIKGVCSEIFKQLLLWGVAPWWPKDSLMKIERVDGNDVVANARYRYKVNVPFVGPGWLAVNRVVDTKNMYLRRDFFEGSFEGFEEFSVYPDDNGYGEVTYTFAADVKGLLAKMFWERGGKEKHIANIDLILKVLKTSIEKKER